MANKNADIRLLIGAEGGSSTGGALIKQELQSYFKDGLKIKIKLDDVDIGSIKARVAEQQKSVSSTKAELDINKQLEKSFERAAALRKKTGRTDELKQAAAINKYLEQEYQLKLKSQQATKQASEQSSQKYWDGRFKDSVNDLTASNTVLKQMSQYYKELEKSSAQVAANTEKERAAQEKLASTNAKISANATSQKASFQQYLQTLDPSVLGKYNTEIQSIFKNFEAGANGSGEALQNAQNGMKTFKATMKEIGAEGKNIFTYLQGKIQTFAVYLASSAITIGLVSGFKSAVDSVYDLNQALINLRIVTGDSNTAAQALLSTYNQMAQELGSTTTAVADAAIEWQRQGYGVEESNTLLKDSMALSIVGMMDSEEAAKSLTAAMKSYGVSVDDAISIVDKWTSIDQVAATSAGDIATAAQQVATTANLVGVSLDKLSAQIAVISETTQDAPESVGNALKTIYTRMRNVKEGMMQDPTSGEDLSAVETTLKGMGIALRDSNSEFRDFDDVLQDVYEKWDSLSSVQQAAISKAMAGTYQYEKFSVLMSNYSKVLDYTKVAQDSAGTSMQKLGTYQEGLEAKQNKLTAAFENMANSVIPSGIIGGLLDLGTGVANLASHLGGAPAAIIATATALLTLNGAIKGIKASSFGSGIKQTVEGVRKPSMTGLIVRRRPKEAA